MTNEIDKRLIIIPQDVYERIPVKSPARYYIIDAIGNKVFVKTTKKEIAQEIIDNHYGKGKYRVITEGIVKPVKKVTAR